MSCSSTLARIFFLGTVGGVAIAGCSADPSHPSSAQNAQDELNETNETGGLLKTLNALAGFAAEGTVPGDFSPGIRVGTPQGKHAAAYLQDRMTRLGLADIHQESYNFPQHLAERKQSSLSVVDSHGATIGPMAFDIFEGSGAGAITNTDIVWVGSGKPADFSSRNVRGKIAFVQRNSSYHRSKQYKNAVEAGAVAMLYMSEADDNQIQIGSIRWAWEPMGAIPTITVGKEDGGKIYNAIPQRALGLTFGDAPRATIDVRASVAPATGQTIIGKIKGKDDTHHIVIGAHYDTWYTGSVDNGGGVAGLLDLAEYEVRRAQTEGPPPYTLVFAAYDGEEVGLYGGYDYLRKHQDEGLLTAVNLEMPSSAEDDKDGILARIESDVSGIASSKATALDESIADVGLAGTIFSQGLLKPATTLSTPYKIWVSLDLVSSQFGGIIPTDIQGIYRSGISTLSTATGSQFYHTPADTPDKVDLAFLAKAISRFDLYLARVSKEPVGAFVGHDSSLWDADLTAGKSGSGYAATAQVFDRGSDGLRGKALVSQDVAFTFFCDDFFASADKHATTDASGKVSVSFSATEIHAIKNGDCSGRKYIHINAGKDYPLVEKVRALP